VIVSRVLGTEILGTELVTDLVTGHAVLLGIATWQAGIGSTPAHGGARRDRREEPRPLPQR
jgi:hypothetical protein